MCKNYIKYEQTKILEDDKFRKLKGLESDF